MTHSLFGYALARALPAAIARGAAKQRALAVCAVLASNVPDADFVIGPFAANPKLSYLLHHRGHTHTLAIALPLGLCIGAACARVARLDSPRDGRHVWLLGAAAGLLHVLFDWFNNYGVHPFYPFDDRWYYGDSVFIIEPLLLAAMIPLLAVHGQSRGGRLFGWLLAAAWLALVFAAGRLPPALAWTLTFASALWLLAVRVVPLRGAATLAAVAAVVAAFFAASWAAEARVAAALRSRAPRERVLDLASTPFPGNPLCWNTIAVSLDDRGVYRARHVYTTLAPSWFAPEACDFAPSTITAPLAAAQLAGSTAVAFGRAFQGSAKELRALAREHCDARALLRFARVPYWAHVDGRPVLGDLRYDNGPAIEFAELPLGGACPRSLPPWVAPRSDVLRPER